MTEKLNSLLGQQCHVEAKLRNVSLLVPRLNTIKSDAQHLSEMIQFTCSLAENVSAKVRELDIAKVSISEFHPNINIFFNYTNEGLFLGKSFRMPTKSK